MGQDDGEDDEGLHHIVWESKGRSVLGENVWGTKECQGTWMDVEDWAVYLEVYISRHLQPSLCSSVEHFASIGKMSRSQGEPQRWRLNQAYQGHIHKAKTYKQPSANHPTQVDLYWKRANNRNTWKLWVVIMTYSMKIEWDCGHALVQDEYGTVKKIPTAPFLGRDMTVTVDSEPASDAKDLTPAQWKICLDKWTILQLYNDC